MVSGTDEFHPDFHPVGLLSQLKSAHGDGLVLSFSQYFYRPRHLLDERTIFEVPISKVDASWVVETVSHLEKEWELALNSVVLDGRGRRKHLGMIDFVGRPSIEIVRERVRKFLGPRIAAGLILFDSGRSIHGYSMSLMGPASWHHFLGRLLLMNMPGEEPVVDERWIGHRLIGGYSALRWSANSTYYSMVPRRMRVQ